MIEITQKIPYTQFYYNSPWFETTTSSKWKDKWNDQYQCRSTIKNTSLSITNVPANYLGTYSSKSKIRRTTLMAAVLTYFLPTCFLLTASDWSVQCTTSQVSFNRNCPATSAPLLWSCSGCIKTVFQDDSFFFCICKAEVGTKLTFDADTIQYFNGNGNPMSHPWFYQDAWWEPSQPPTVNLNHSPLLLLNRTALCVLPYRFSLLVRCWHWCY